jgi:hypothetical protein
LHVEDEGRVSGLADSAANAEATDRRGPAQPKGVKRAGSRLARGLRAPYALSMTVEDASAPSAGAGPRRAPLALCAAILLMGVGAVVAIFFGHVAPTPLGTELALAGGVAAGAALAWAARDGGALSRSAGLSASSRSFMTRHAITRVPLLGLVGGFFAYVALSGGLFWLVDRFAGAPTEQAVEITGWSSPGRRTCAHFEFRGEAFVLEPAACARRVDESEAIPGRQLILVGHATPLGLAVESWRLGPRP